MFDMPEGDGLPQLEEREFDLSQGDGETFDEMLEWLEEENRVVKIIHEGASQIVGLPNATFLKFDDFALSHAYLPHWELDGFAVEDMPTIHDLLWAADESLLEDSLRELIEGAPSPSGKPEVEKALSYAVAMVERLKNFGFDSCDGDPKITIPYIYYRCNPDTHEVSPEYQARSYARAEIDQWSPKHKTSCQRFWWSDALGYKAWFGGLSIRDQYRALAWLVCMLLQDSFVNYGIWMGDLPDDEKNELAQELAEGAQADLRKRMKDLSRRILPIEKLVMIEFRMDEELFQRFEKACHDSGLSIQNAMQIAIQRFIENPESSMMKLEPENNV